MIEILKTERLGLESGELEQLFKPESCFGSAPAMIERTLAEWRRLRASPL